MLLFDYVFNLGCDFFKDRIIDKSAKNKLHEALEGYFSKKKIENYDCSLDEEIDFSGLVNFVSQELHGKLEKRLFGMTKEERDQAYQDIINQALVYSHAKSGEAQKRVERIIRDAIDILQDIHWSEVPQSTQYVAVTVIDEMQKQNEKQTKEIIAAIKGINTQTSSQYKRKLSSIQGDDIPCITKTEGESTYLRSVSEIFDSLWETSRKKRELFEQSKTKKKIYKELIAAVEVAPFDRRNNRKDYNNLFNALIDATHHFKKTNPITLSAKGGQGKSTQLMILWKKLENHKTADGKHDCVVFYFNLKYLSAKTDLLDEILAKYDIPKEEYRYIEMDLKQQPSKTDRHYFLVLDGLDEINDSSPVPARITELASIERGYQNLEIIIAGRNSANKLFPDQITVSMVLKDLESDSVKKWLSKYHPEKCIEEEYKNIKGSPMLLTLAYEVESNLTDQDDVSNYIKRRIGFPLSQGEVIWNYSEYILAKYRRKYKNGSSKIKFAKRLMHEILPYIAYHYFYNGIHKKNIGQDEQKEGMAQSELEKMLKSLDIKEDEIFETIRLMKETFSGIIRMDSNGYQFEHRLFQDFFSMLYVSNLAKKLYDNDKKPLPKKEFDILTDARILENNEYYNFMICTLPFSFYCFGNNYERDFLSIFDSFIDIYRDNDREYNSQRIQVARFLRTMYSIWMADYFIANKLSNEANNSRMAWRSYYALSDVSEVLEESENNILIPNHCIVFVLYVLSQIFRVGSLFMHDVENSKLNGFEPDLNKSFEYVYKGIKMQSQEIDISDGYNYIAKIFFAAIKKITLHFFSCQDDYIVKKEDLLGNIRELSIFDYHFSDKINEDIAKIKPGDHLSRAEAKERLQCFDTIANDFLKKGDEKGCIFSLNLLALKEEMAQERKPYDKRDFTKALEYYLKGSSLDRAASHYSAKKAAQLLVEKKAGIDANENVCVIGKADREKTILKVNQMMDIAEMNRSFWSELYYHKGMLKKNFYYDKNASQKNVKMLSGAFDDFVFCTSQAKEKHISVLLVLIETGLELTRINKQISDHIQTEIHKAMESFNKALPGFIKKAQGVHFNDKWVPSAYVVNESLCVMKEYAVTYEKEISILSLSSLMQECLTCIREQEQTVNSLRLREGDINQSCSDSASNRIALGKGSRDCRGKTG
ncbi:MAG: NACHT domain-containing protein [Clostridia bacterium]|nr:NACHT domain-containing protein [Clostridia bacterium]